MSKVDAALAREVRSRANGACEYCRMPQIAHRARFPIDHIIARQHGGKPVSENLALACLHCNSRKGPNISGIDPLTGQITPLFNPRMQQWGDHFQIIGTEIRGTAEGRATVAVLDMNDPEYVELRQSLIAEGFYPPPG